MKSYLLIQTRPFCVGARQDIGELAGLRVTKENKAELGEDTCLGGFQSTRGGGGGGGAHL